MPTNYWELVWTNPPLGTNIALTAKATDNGGASTVSAPVLVSILPSLPPPTNRPPIVSIVATDPVAIEGTNCWTWPGLASPVADVEQLVCGQRHLPALHQLRAQGRHLHRVPFRRHQR